MSKSETRVLAEASNCVFLDIDRLFVGLFWGDSDAVHGQLFVESATKFLAELDGPHGVLIVVSANAKPPSRALRKDLVEAISMLSERTECYGSVLAGKGVKASTLRAIMGALLMAMPRVSKGRVCSTIEEGIEWCSKHLAFDAAKVRRAVSEYQPAQGW